MALFHTNVAMADGGGGSSPKPKTTTSSTTTTSSSNAYNTPTNKTGSGSSSSNTGGINPPLSKATMYTSNSFNSPTGTPSYTSGTSTAPKPNDSTSSGSSASTGNKTNTTTSNTNTSTSTNPNTTNITSSSNTSNTSNKTNVSPSNATVNSESIPAEIVMQKEINKYEYLCKEELSKIKNIKSEIDKLNRLVTKYEGVYNKLDNADRDYKYGGYVYDGESFHSDEFKNMKVMIEDSKETVKKMITKIENELKDIQDSYNENKNYLNKLNARYLK